MAKKSVREILNSSETDQLIYRLYNCGVIQSTIFHTIIFLILALTFIRPVSLEPIKITLSFSESLVEDLYQNENISDISELSNSVTISTEESEKIPLDEDMLNLNVETMEELVIDNQSDAIPEKDLLKTIDPDKQSKKQLSTKISKNNELSVQDFKPVFDPSLATIGNSPNIGDKSSSGEMSEIAKRLWKAGAKTGDIQISISWNTTDDIDLHVMHKFGAGRVNIISWMNKRDTFGGMLDVDMNAFPYGLTNQPVENIFWPHGSSPPGDYIVAVHFFKSWTGIRNLPVIVIIKNGQQVETLRVNAILGSGPQEIFSFRR